MTNLNSDLATPSRPLKSLPSHLAASQALGAKEGEPIAQFEIGDYQNFVYLILDWKTRKAGIIDPQTNLSPLLNCLNRHGFTLDKILLTHTHFDHIAGVPELIRLFPKVPILVHAGDLHRFKTEITESAQMQKIQEGDTVSIGTLSIQVLHTPGHSAGECSYFLNTEPPYLFTGDTVFIRDCGRTDFPTGSNEEMFESLQKIKKLPPETIFLPGHHYKEECATTLAKEMKESPPFLCQSVEDLAGLP